MLTKDIDVAGKGEAKMQIEMNGYYTHIHAHQD